MATDKGWQPIETAPKDVPVLVYYDHYAAPAEGGDFLAGKGIAIARWSEGWWESNGREAGDSYWMPAVWFAWFNDDYVGHVVNPMFWMPLPPAPGEGE